MSNTHDLSSLIQIGLNAVVFAVHKDDAKVLIVPQNTPSNPEKTDSLPSGLFDPVKDRTLNLGLRRWIHDLTGLQVGYVEQLYTFGNKYRDSREADGGPRYLSVSYLGLTSEKEPAEDSHAKWVDIYHYLPWEDWRDGRPALINEVILPELEKWCLEETNSADVKRRQGQVFMAFGDRDDHFDHERVLTRLELLYNSGLLFEAHRDFQNLKRHVSSFPITRDLETHNDLKERVSPKLGLSMSLDHRRILASALERVRGKLRYRPLVFELMPEEFTLFHLQRVVEALSGTRLHKQNFRRLMQNEQLVEETGRMEALERGRPAALFRFREQVFHERPMPKA